MNLRGQHGYAMAALLVALSVMGVLMTAAMPTWRQSTQREKEAELIFRGQQYARAIGLFQRKAGPGVLPPNLDVLVDQHFLRAKYRDPITNEEFDVLTQTQQAQSGQRQPGQTQPGAGQSGAVSSGAQPTASPGTIIGASQSTGRLGIAGGVMGVASKSKDASIRIYNGRTHYNEWQFVFIPQVQAPTGPGGQPGQGGRGTPTTAPGVGGRERGPASGTSPQRPTFGASDRLASPPTPMPRPSPRD